MVLTLGVLAALASAPAGANPNNLILAQYPGSPGYPPGGPQPWGDPHMQYCAHLGERMQRLEWRMHRAPPWERDRLGTRYFQIQEEQRIRCFSH
jgi:hypothetical protein